ncbi:PA14 domain-containing protein [Fusarium austroafricanum]|uniref:PA14 domain-containing protein n=1 Tax=Fusarium austroafricanum TaxID=2364996 RepID=A0A8H4NZP3_9HYPO|nr:PA14 domain-containing protein [Fusarium austroafricanum]
MPPCHKCVTITTSSPEPYVTTLPPDSDDAIPTVVICSGPPNGPGVVITRVPGPTEGAVTILHEPDCDTGCKATFIITTVPHRPSTETFTTKVPGTVPRTATILPPTDCTTNCIPTVRITTVPSSPITGGIIRPTVPGSVPGTATFLPPPGCTTDCSTHIVITTVPSTFSMSQPTTTQVPSTKVEPSTEGPSSTEEQSSSLPSSGTKPPTTDNHSTIERPSSTESTSSKLPTTTEPASTTEKPSTAEILSISENPATTSSVPPNAFSKKDGYGISDGKSGVGPDYYRSQPSPDQGSTTDLSVPGGDNNDATSDTTNPDESANYTPGLTKSYGGMKFNANNFTIVFTGYFVPPKTGSYKFCIKADNRDALYIGSDSAFPCGDASNSATQPGKTPLAEHWYGKDVGDPNCNSIDMVEGYYYPLRSVYGNWGTPEYLTATVQGPDDDSGSSDVSGKVAPDTCSK